MKEYRIKIYEGGRKLKSKQRGTSRKATKKVRKRENLKKEVIRRKKWKEKKI